jgi:predicted dehydrogenase
MRIGLLGSGAMGQKHLAAYAALPGVAVVTRNTAVYGALGAEIDQLSREDLQRAMIADRSLDALDICLPTPLHPRVVIAALEAGKHVLCEKPLALSVEECTRVLAAARESGRIFMVAHVLRFFPAYRLLAEAVRTNRYGRVRRVCFTRSSSIPTWADWLAQPAQSGGAVLDLLVHDFDQAIALFGQPAGLIAEPIESEHTVRCVLHYPRGNRPAELTVEIEGGWFADGRPFAMGFHAYFAETELVFRDNRLSVLRAAGPSQDPAREELPLPDIDPYAEQLRYFIECCRSRSEPDQCPPAASAAAVALALAVRSLAQRAPGKLTPYC